MHYHNLSQNMMPQTSTKGRFILTFTSKKLWGPKNPLFSSLKLDSNILFKIQLKRQNQFWRIDDVFANLWNYTWIQIFPFKFVALTWRHHFCVDHIITQTRRVQFLDFHQKQLLNFTIFVNMDPIQIGLKVQRSKTDLLMEWRYSNMI